MIEGIKPDGGEPVFKLQASSSFMPRLVEILAQGTQAKRVGVLRTWRKLILRAERWGPG